MNKKETINNIQRRLQSEKGFPDVSFLDKLSEENVFHLFMDLVLSSDFVKNKKKKCFLMKNNKKTIKWQETLMK